MKELVSRNKFSKSRTIFINRITIIFILLMCINSFTVEIINAFTGSSLSTYFTYSDIYADLLKTSLSLKTLIQYHGNSIDVNNISQPFLGYILNNPYQEYPLEKPSPSIYHHPPLTFFYFQINALLMAKGYKLYEIIILNVFLLSLLFSFILLACKRKLDFSGKALIFTALLLFLSYPTLFALNRGNFQSTYCSAFFIMGGIMLVSDSRLAPTYLAIAANIRPNIVSTLLPLIGQANLNIKTIGRCFLFGAMLATISYLVATHFTPTYNFTNFLDALRYYNINYIQGGHGDSYNSSLHSFSKFLATTGLPYPTFFYPLTFLVVSLSILSCIKQKQYLCARSYIGCIICMLLTPTFADYHLLLLVLPIILAIHEFEKKPFLSYLISLFALLIISPKLGIKLNGFTLNSIVNPLLAISSLCILSFTKWGSRQPKSHTELAQDIH